MEYPKINSLWKRQGWYFDDNKKKDPEYQSGRQSFIIGDYAEPAFGNIKEWLVDEKIDGTNVRIMWQRPFTGGPHDVSFGGRTDNAQMPPRLLQVLQELFPFEKCLQEFSSAERVIMFGEGYGPKIQSCGGNYRNDIGFILFDIYIDGWWLQRKDVKEIAKRLCVDVVPELGLMTEVQVENYVKSKPMSLCSNIPQMMEGVVCREPNGLLLRKKSPIMWKLKCKEFV